jgi:hypothetical protein
MNEEKIKVGDLVRIVKKSDYYLADHAANENITGVVVDVTLGEGDTLESHLDYWVRVVFLDNSKATLFHDEVEVISTKG